MFSIASLSVPLLILIFAASAALVWVAGAPLTRTTDALSNRWGLGEALGGLILLGIVTNLPELAITVSAAMSGNMTMAVGNLLGGIPMQLMVLVLLDRFTGEPKPLSTLSSNQSVQVEALFCIILLAIVVLAPSLTFAHDPFRLGVTDVLVVGSWVATLLIMSRLSKSKPAKAAPRTSRQLKTHAPVALGFTLAAGATLAGGIGLEAASDALSQRFGINGLLFGATVLAAATSLPELTTGLSAIRAKEYDLSVSDIVGGNSVLVVVLVLGSLISGSSAFSLIDQSATTLAAIGIAMTAALCGGLAIKPQRKFAGIGPDNWMMTLIFLIGLIGLYHVGG